MTSMIRLAAARPEALRKGFIEARVMLFCMVHLITPGVADGWVTGVSATRILVGLVPLDHAGCDEPFQFSRMAWPVIEPQ